MHKQARILRRVVTTSMLVLALILLPVAPSFADGLLCHVVKVALSLLSEQKGCAPVSAVSDIVLVPSSSVAHSAAPVSPKSQIARLPATNSPAVVARATNAAPRKHPPARPREVRPMEREAMIHPVLARVKFIGWLALSMMGGVMLSMLFMIAAGKRRLKASRESEKAADVLTRSRNDLLANAAHELRTPLTVIKMLLSMLQRHGLSAARLSELIPHVSTSIESLEHMITLLVTYADLQPGYPVPYDDVEIMSIAKAEVGHEKLGADAARVVLQGSCGLVRGNGRLLQQALGELISNALKFSGPRELVEVRIETFTNSVEIRVADKGPGFPFEEMTEAFVQGDSSPTRPHEGLGLGLALARRIVEAHSGQLSHKAREGGGSIMTVSLQPARSLIFTT